MQSHLRKHQPCHCGNQDEHIWEWACRKYLWQGSGIWAESFIHCRSEEERIAPQLGEMAEKE